MLVDTSVAIALMLADHPGRSAALAARRRRRLGLAGHAYFETYSVLTRLPAPARRDPDDAARLLAHNFPETRFLDVRAQTSLGKELARAGIGGGAVYDALVGAVARAHRLSLLTRDVRATEVYRALGVDAELVA